MIKIKNAKHSNLLFGTVMFLGFLLTWGCSKNVAPPDVEEPPTPVVEQIPEPTPEGDFSQEKVEGIEESGADFAGSGTIETEGPEAFDEIDVVDVAPPSGNNDSMTEEPVAPETDFTQEPGFGIDAQSEVAEVGPEEITPMEMQEDVFVAPGAEKIQEARVIPDFKDEQQLQDIHFEYDRDKLDSQTKNILQSNADWLKKNPNARVEIQGHADERGTNNYNLGLGERRALQTKKYLIDLGIDESRLYTISYGEEKPFCFDSNENCWWENRRAHFTVAD